MTDERRQPRLTRAQLDAADFENLMLRDDFKRFLFTFFELAGMFASDFHSEGRIHAWRAGRRSLGLDILRSAEHFSGPTAMLAILQAELTANQETSGDQSRYHEKRLDELGIASGDEPSVTRTFLDYSADADGAGGGSPAAGARP